MASIRLVAAAASLILVSGLRADGPGCPGSIQWDGGAGTTAWTTITNWSSNVMPAATDDVCIPDLAVGVEVVHSTGTHAVHSLAGAGGLQVSGGTLSFAVDSPGLGQLMLSGGTLSCGGNLPVTNAFNWSGGTMTGSGTTSVPGGSLSGSTKALAGGRVLQTSGTTTWTGTGLVRLDGGAAVENGGVWDAQGNASVARLDEASGFHNLPGATFKKTAGGGTTAVAVPLENEGMVSVQNGTLSLAGGSFTTGALQGTSGTTLQFDGGDHTVAAGASLTANTVAVTSGSLTLDGSYNVNTSSFSGGTVTFHPVATLTKLGALSISGGAVVDLSSGETIASPHLSLFGGTLGGTDTLTAAIDWTGGEMRGAGITAGPLYATGSGDKDLREGRLLRMSGGTWDQGRIRLGGGAAIENSTAFSMGINLNCGIWGSLVLEDLGGGGGFRNLPGASMRVKCGDRAVRVPFTNDGSVTLEVASLSLEAGGSASGRFENTDAAWDHVLRFGGGTFRLAPSSVVNTDEVEVAAGDVVGDGAYGVAKTTVSGGSFTLRPAATVSFMGEIAIAGTGMLTLDSGEAIAPSTLTLNGGTLAGSDAVSVAGTTSWSANTMTGAGLTHTVGALTMSGFAARDLTGGRRLQTSGSTQWLGTGPVRLQGGASIQNSGTWSLADAMLQDLGGAGAFSNDPGATFANVGGTGASEVQIPFVNAGTVRASAGTLRFTGGYTQSGGATVLDGGTLVSTSALVIQGGSVSGVGTLSGGLQSSGAVAPGLSAGLLTIDGSYGQRAGGSLEIEIGGLSAGTEHDQLEVAGAATLAGRLNVVLIDGFVPQDGDAFTVLTASTIAGTFGSLSLPPAPPGLGWSVAVQPGTVLVQVSPDQDADGVGDAGDCAPADPSVGYLPGEVAGITFAADKQTLAWAADAENGTVYDVVRGPAETCLAASVAVTQVVDAAEPDPGASFSYLVRARNVCGAGTYGTTSGGTPRIPTACP